MENLLKHTINKLSDKVRFLEEEKDELLDNLNGAQDRYNDINYEEIDQKLMNLEKDLSHGTKSANQIQKDCEKLAEENQELKDRLNELHEGEPTVLTILQDNYEKICPYIYLEFPYSIPNLSKIF